MSGAIKALLSRPWIWSFLGAAAVWLSAVAFTGGYGAGGMMTAALSLSVFTVIVGVGQMFVITLGPGNVDLSLPANIGLASAVAMKTMGGDDSWVVVGLAAALACGLAVGIVNYLLIWALRIPPIIATLSASFIIQSVDISYGRGLQIKPPPGFADFTNIVIAGVPLLAVLTLLFTIGASVALNRTVWGRSVLAIGQNIRAARLAGIKVEPVRFATYALCGTLGGLAGAAGRLFPRRECGHRRRIPACVDRGRGHRRDVCVRWQGERAGRLGGRAVSCAAAHYAEHIRSQRGRAAPPHGPDHRCRYYCRRW